MAETASPLSRAITTTQYHYTVSNGDESKRIILIWLDSNIDSLKDSTTIMRRLHEINDNIVTYTEPEPCLAYINSNKHKRIILILSDSYAITVLRQVHNLRQINTIFIYYRDAQIRRDDLVIEYTKIVATHVELSSLLKSIREQIDIIYGQLEVITFYNQSQNATKILSNKSAQFLWFQIFTYIIENLPRNERSMKDMLTICRQYFSDDPSQLKEINEFEKRYRPEEAILWYTKECFVHKLVNKALRTEDIDQLYAFRFFIGDLSKSLVQEHKKLLESRIEKLIVYRGTILSNQELDKLKKEKSIISTNSFFSTSRCRRNAQNFMNKCTKYIDSVPVLFEIECDIQQLGDTVVVADISQIGEYPDEFEVLFNLNSTFRIKEIKFDEEVWIIRMITTNDGQNIAREYIETTRRETEEKSVTIMWGRLICDIGQYEKSQKYFEQLLITDANTEDVALIEFNIGRALYYRGKWKQARDHFDRAYKIMMSANPARIKESACVLNSIGHDLQRQEMFNDAHDYYNRALEIRTKYYPENHPDIAHSLHSIGSIFDDQEDYDKALTQYRLALDIRRKYFPRLHPTIACSLNNIGIVLKKQGKYKDAVNNYREALTIYEEFYPAAHPNTATTLYNIGSVLEAQKKYEEALVNYKKALFMYEKCHPSDHPDIIASRDCIQSLTRAFKTGR